MKLLKLKIDSENGFRSLGKGFEISFHQSSDSSILNTFRPICFVGLNGCGKSNVLEALSLIFYHMELCVGVHLPPSIKNGEAFSPNNAVIDAFTLEYLIQEPFKNLKSEPSIVKVTISKEKNQIPVMFKESLLEAKGKRDYIDLRNLSDGNIALAKSYLPNYVVGYSSGENETLSIPFIKSRLIHLHEFREATINDILHYSSPENGLIYVDANMSQAILLCCLLFEDARSLQSLSTFDNTGILGVTRFRMRLRETFFASKMYSKEFSYFHLFKKMLFRQLDSCATMSWFDENNKAYYFDFWINDATKKAFRYYFHSGMQCFQVFRLLYELNMHEVTDLKEHEIFSSSGVYTKGKFSMPGSDDDVFHFLDFYIKKQVGSNGESKELLLRQLSDGEQQFIHTMAICLLLKDSESLILLDEPETHFNPGWRSRFISILNETLQNACSDKYANFKKEVVITSHSPFIISDCLSENVIIMDKNDKGEACAATAAQKGISTYGTSISLLMSQIFNNTTSIGKLAEKSMKEVMERGGTKDEIKKRLNERFGDSVEKLLAIESLR